MSDPTEALQVAVAAALLGAAPVTSIVAGTALGPAVFAEHQAFPIDAFPRLTVEPPQLLDRDNSCADGWLAYVTIHSWARGPAASLEAGRLAGAVRAPLKGALVLAGGFAVTAFGFESSRPVGDPDALVEHIVSVFRYVVRRSA
jgi:uncharacterized protein DUF3168